MTILSTDRLRLRRLVPHDAEFIHTLVNEPAFLRNIGDRGVHDLDGARAYIERQEQSYERRGFALYLTSLRESDLPIGICGLVGRDTLDHPDVGFAFLSAHWGRGYATESAAAVLEHARRDVGLTRVLGITVPDNQASIRVLEKIGLRFEQVIQLAGDDTPLALYVCEL
ncbi:GNAT family N-acetyltransferase [Haliangium sp.]|uniref:GNAT family N-acetyltransferase n=1 Tax=Haliangium sp. TaxID=2663208 RepID=UPI003D09F2DE